MKWNWIIIALAIFAAILLGIWIVKRNKKFKRSRVRKLENGYGKLKVDEPQI